jgi:hypothetical protein
VPEGCPAWTGTLETPDDFVADPLLAEAFAESGFQPYLGDQPLDVTGEYCVSGAADEFDGEPISVPIRSRLTLSAQTPQGSIHYREVGETGDAVQTSGFVTGTVNGFTLWFNTYHPGGCNGADEHDAFMLSGTPVDAGTLDAEGLTVVLSGLDCEGFCPGTWAHTSLTFDRLGDCPSCDEIDPTCNGALVPICGGSAPGFCTRSNCGQVLGCHETEDCAGSAPSGCGRATEWNQCSRIRGCYGDGNCVGTPNPCSVNGSSFSCGNTDGCFWNASLGECEGEPWSCASYSGENDCVGQSGCSWDDACEGSPTPCSELLSFWCEDQPGCYVVTNCEGTPTPCSELSEARCEDQPGCDVEWVPP